ncbi:CDP-alcohol phosphatidyltransferase family protein [soil metagenome]
MASSQLPTSDPVPPAQFARLSDRVLTVPNLLSIARLLGVPLFLWLLLGPQWDVAAVVVLALAGFTDYLDGKLARALGQTSKLGVLLDPLADRLYIVSTLVAFVLRDVIPLWLAALLLGRDLVLALCLPVLRHHGYGVLPVHYLGKAATFNLLYAFPLLLLAVGDSLLAEIARPIAYGFTAWGVGLYLWSGALYLIQVVGLVRASRAAAR